LGKGSWYPTRISEQKYNATKLGAGAPRKLCFALVWTLPESTPVYEEKIKTFSVKKHIEGLAEWLKR
jgi:hypothetical protein